MKLSLCALFSILSIARVASATNSGMNYVQQFNPKSSSNYGSNAPYQIFGDESEDVMQGANYQLLLCLPEDEKTQQDFKMANSTFKTYQQSLGNSGITLVGRSLIRLAVDKKVEADLQRAVIVKQVGAAKSCDVRLTFTKSNLVTYSSSFRKQNSCLDKSTNCESQLLKKAVDILNKKDASVKACIADNGNVSGDENFKKDRLADYAKETQAFENYFKAIVGSKIEDAPALPKESQALALELLTQRIGIQRGNLSYAGCN